MYTTHMDIIIITDAIIIWPSNVVTNEEDDTSHIFIVLSTELKHTLVTVKEWPEEDDRSHIWIVLSNGGHVSRFTS